MRSWVKTPDDQILLDIRSLLHSPSKSEVLKNCLISLSYEEKLNVFLFNVLDGNGGCIRCRNGIR